MLGSKQGKDIRNTWYVPRRLVWIVMVCYSTNVSPAVSLANMEKIYN